MIDEPNDPNLAPGASPDPTSPHHAPIKPAVEARAGVELGRMRWVLRISMGLVAVGFFLAWALGR
jgi:hypothetical protein